MKRILVLNYEFPPLGGGAGNATHYLLKEFAKDSDLEIDLVTSSLDRFRVERFSDNINIHFLNIGKAGNIHYQSIFDLLKYSWRAYRYSKKLIKEKKFNLCHAFFGIPCGYIAMKLGLPYIVSLRGSDVPFQNKRFYWLDKILFKRLSRKIWKNAKAVIANSQKLKDDALASSPKQNIGIIINGINTEEFKPVIDKKTSLPLKIVSVGRLIERKGYKYLLESLVGLKDVELSLVGDGDMRNELEEMAKEKSIAVKFLGAVKHKDLPQILREHDIFVLASFNEGMSNALLEAMACGLPIVTTDTGGAKELIRGNGFIVPIKSAQAIKEAIQTYQNSKDLAYSHSRVSRSLAEGLSWKDVSKEYKKLYE